MKIIIGIIVTLVVAIFAIFLYPITLLAVILIHALKARKAIKSIEGEESFFQKYKTIVKPFALINGLLLILTSGICFGIYGQGFIGFIYMVLLSIGMFMVVGYSLNVPTVDNNGSNKNAAFGKVIPSVVSAVMCAIMVLQIANYTPPVAIVANEPTDSQSVSESAPEEKSQEFAASSEHEPSSAQEVESTPESSASPLKSSAPEAPAALSEESSSPAAESIPPTVSDTPASKLQETESTPTMSNVQSANDGSSQSGDGNSSEAHFNDYDTPKQQDTKEYVINTSTKKVHRPTCSDVKKIKPENYSTIKNLTDALNNGYVPCKRCSPN